MNQKRQPWRNFARFASAITVAQICMAPEFLTRYPVEHMLRRQRSLNLSPKQIIQPTKTQISAATKKT